MTDTHNEITVECLECGALVTLTAKDKGEYRHEGKCPKCGLPYHAVYNPKNGVQVFAFQTERPNAG